MTIHFDDGASYIKDLKFQYDVIIIDSTDPFSVGESLFKEEFYETLKEVEPSIEILLLSKKTIRFFNFKCPAKLIAS